MRDRSRLPLLVVLGVAAHLTIGAWPVLMAARWLGWTLAAAAFAAVTAAHIIGLRRLARRRRATALDDPRTDQR
jgi:membrane protein implicated in regulation of membrane protease activity